MMTVGPGARTVGAIVALAADGASVAGVIFVMAMDGASVLGVVFVAAIEGADVAVVALVTATDGASVVVFTTALVGCCVPPVGATVPSVVGAVVVVHESGGGVKLAASTGACLSPEISNTMSLLACWQTTRSVIPLSMVKPN